MDTQMVMTSPLSLAEEQRRRRAEATRRRREEKKGRAAAASPDTSPEVLYELSQAYPREVRENPLYLLVALEDPALFEQVQARTLVAFTLALRNRRLTAWRRLGVPILKASGWSTRWSQFDPTRMIWGLTLQCRTCEARATMSAAQDGDYKRQEAWAVRYLRNNLRCRHLEEVLGDPPSWDEARERAQIFPGEW